MDETCHNHEGVLVLHSMFEDFFNTLFAILFSLIIQVVISAIAQIIIDWLFSDTEGAEYYGKIYNVD